MDSYSGILLAQQNCEERTAIFWHCNITEKQADSFYLKRQFQITDVKKESLQSYKNVIEHTAKP